MGKSKSASKGDAKAVKPMKEASTKVKEVAKQVGGKADKKSKKAKKEPTPEPSSDSSASSDEAMGSASSASSDDESELETAKPVGKANGKANGLKVNGAAKGAAKAKKDDSSDSSESSASSDDEDDAPPPEPVLAKAVAAKAAAAAKADSSDDSEDDSESDDDEAVPGAVDSKELHGKLEKVASNQASSDEDSGSDASSSEESDSEEEKKAPVAAPLKRKAEADVEPVAKKVKTAAIEGDGEASGNLFVGNLSWNVDEEWLVAEFGKFGELAGTRLISDRETGRSKGFGYVDFVNAEDAVKAVEGMNGKELDGRALNVNPANARPKPADRTQQRQKSFGDATSPPSETLFVANIAFGATEDTIGEAFGEYGTVTNVRLPTDKDSGQPKGFGYVQFAALDEAVAAYDAMKGAVIEGRPLRLDYATPKPDREAGGFGGGRGGGRGGFDRGGRGGDRGRGRGRGGFDRGGRGGGRGGRGGTTNRGGFGDFQGKKKSFE